jgi:hypothetical protein
MPLGQIFHRWDAREIDEAVDGEPDREDEYGERRERGPGNGEHGRNMAVDGEPL